METSSFDIVSTKQARLAVKFSSKLTQDSRSILTHLPVFLFPGESFLPGNLLRPPERIFFAPSRAPARTPGW